MSRNGGYAIMDLKNEAFTSGTAKTVTGVFPITQRKKAVLISGLKVGTVYYPDFYAVFTSATADSVTTATAEIRLDGATMTIAISNATSTNMTVTVTADTPDTPTT